MSQQIQATNQNQPSSNCRCSEEPIIYKREYEKIDLVERNHFEKYADKYFQLTFSKFCVSHFVGILPFICPNSKQLKILFIGPKKRNGSRESIEQDMLNFSYLSVFSGYPESFNEIKVADEPKWKIKDLSNQRLGIYFLSIIYGVVLDNLCKRDFRKSYIPREEELLSRVKGRINQREYLNNWWSGKRLNIPCRWEEFTEDNLENRVLKYALKKLDSFENDGSWHNKILSDNFKIPKWKFQDVSDIAIFNPGIFNNLKLDKISRYYKEALYVAKQIIFGSEDIKAEEGIPPILFDTNTLFERVVQRICEIAGMEDGWKVEKNPGKPIFENNEKEFKPDVVMTKNGQTIVADAKYKLILELEKETIEDVENILLNPDVKDKPSTMDLYQMYFYMRNLNAKKGIFFVPVWEDTKFFPKKFIKSPLDNEEAQLYIFPINLGKDCLKEEIKKNIEEFRKEFLAKNS